MCVDDPDVVDILPRLARPLLTYGLGPDAVFRACDVQANGRAWRFTAQRGELGGPLQVDLAIPGAHNVLNALAAIAIATDEGIDDEHIVAGLLSFAGVDRRFQVDENVAVADARVIMVDDYGHHPTEVQAVIETARKVWPEARIGMVYQPHRFSRTRDLFEDFVRVLSRVDSLLLLDVYAAGEAVIPGADGKSLSQAIRQRGDVSPVFAADPDEALEILGTFCSDIDVLIVQGAGNVSQISRNLRGENV